MPYADLSETRLYYVVDGPAHAPTLILSNSLGTSADMWAQQIPQLSRHLRVVRYDTRGHGRSSLPTGEYSFDQLANDVVELMSQLDIKRAHFCGLSMGGPTGLSLALAYPEKVDRLVLCNTAARIGSEQSWAARIAAVQEQGLNTMAPALVERWLSESYRTREPGLSQLLVDMLRRTSDLGYIANCAALRDADLRERLDQIKVPTLILSGTQDLAATPAQGRYLADHIDHARYVELNTSHISNWEEPEIFAHEVLTFLSE